MTLHQFLSGSTVMIILLTTVCGLAVRNTRVVGGRNASPGSWPWMASLNNDGGPFCAGSLIHNQWVLTAAHCLNRNDLLSTTVFLGRQSRSGPNLDEVSMTLESIVCHPSYDSLSNENDICLLKLSAPVEFTDDIRPVGLASAGSTFHSGVSSWVAGFGDTQADSPSGADVLQEVNLPIVGNNECKCAYPFITDTTICAGFREGGKDACNGDSGGPLVTKKDSVWIQSGIVSFGDGCAQPMTPGVYTRVSQYQEWITSNTDGSEPGFVDHTSSGVDSDLNITCPNIRRTSAIINPSPTTTTTRTTTMIPTTTTTTPSIPTTTETPTTTMLPTTTTTPSIPTTTETPNTAMLPTTTTTRTTPSTTNTPTTSKTQTIPIITKPPIKERRSVDSIDSGVNVIHFSHFTSLCLLLVSLYALVGET